MTITKEKIEEMVVKYSLKRQTNDTGSSENQIAILTERISNITNPSKITKKIIVVVED